MSNVENIVFRILNKGHHVAITRGRLVVVPAGNRPVPEDWFKKNAQPIVREICTRLGLTPVIYLAFNTGIYPYKGVDIQFCELLTGESCYANFNVDLTRQRSALAGRAGTMFTTGERGRFTPKPNSSFLKFWDRSGATKPASDTEFYKRMGNLKGIYFTAEYHQSKSERLLKGTITPLEVDSQTISDSFNLSDKPAISERLASDKRAIVVSDKELLKHAETLGLQPDSTTGPYRYGNKVIREYGYKGNVVPINIPIDRGMNIDLESKIEKNKEPEQQSVDEWVSDAGEINTK